MVIIEMAFQIIQHTLLIVPPGVLKLKMIHNLTQRSAVGWSLTCLHGSEPLRVIIKITAPLIIAPVHQNQIPGNDLTGEAAPGGVHIRLINSSPKRLVLISVEPSIRRAKS